MTLTGVDTVAVVVSNRKKALDWYRDVLGLPVAYIAPDIGHWIEVGPSRPLTRIHLCETSEEEGAGGPSGITLLTDDIQREYEELRRKGVRFLSPPEKMDWGEWLAVFVDPDGNEVDLKQPVDPSKWTDSGSRLQSLP
jgi:catechol 2,3-dioxygenase-like lactoylglutathione lyase family enzyme